MRVVLVSDRRVMGPDFGAAVAAAVAALPAGAVTVQVREKDLDGGALLALVRAAMAAGAPVVVNDRVDVALAAGAAGVHLPEHGLAIADARAVVPAGFGIGCSRHTVEAAVRAAAAGAAWVQLGPVFATPGKGPPVGLAALRAARAAMAPGARLIAVGGIDSAAAAAACRDAGADGVAAIRAAWRPGGSALA